MKTCPRCGGTGKVKDDKVLGAQLRELREKTSKSLRGVAKAMGLSPAYVCDLEHGRRGWSIKLEANYRKALEAA